MIRSDAPSQHENLTSLRELPFNPNLRPILDVGIELDLRLAPTRSARIGQARSAIWANLALALMDGPGARVFYSRDYAYYARVRRWVPSWYGRQTMVEVVSELEAAGLIDHCRTLPSPFATRRSTISPRVSLTELGLRTVQDLQFEVIDPIVLRDANGNPAHFRDSRQVRLLRDAALAQNSVLRALTLSLDDRQWIVDEHGLYRDGSGRIFNPRRLQLYRVFNNGDWSQGGRFYGGGWQSLPSRSRAHLRINGEPVCERDYAACHLRLLSAMMKSALPSGDPYEITQLATAIGDGTLARRLTKRSFSILLNAATARQAGGAVAETIDEMNLGGRVRATDVIGALKRRYPEFQSIWHKGIGLRLQRIDSDIAAEVMRSMRGAGFACLPVHDSFVAPQSALATLEVAMNTAFDFGCAAARRLR